MSSELPSIPRDINGKEYVVYRLYMSKWAELTEMLAGLLGDPIASLLKGDAVVPEGVDPRLSQGDFHVLIASLAQKLSARMIMKTCAMMGNCLHVDGAPLGAKKQETWWPSHMADFVPVIKLFLETQYLDFYVGLSESLSNVSEPELDLSASTSE